MTPASKRPVVVTGSVALDTVKTAKGRCKDVLGGSAVYFSMACRFFHPVQLIGAVGGDFPAAMKKLLTGCDIDLTGLEELPGKTFRWSGEFGPDLQNPQTLSTALNVIEHFRPKLKPAHKNPSVAFLANIDPELQWEVLSQLEKADLVACDTMNFWIDQKKPAIKELLAHIDIFFLNDSEAKQLTGKANLLEAARTVKAWGPRIVAIKKGEHGSLILAQDNFYAYPAYPTESVVDPTGAGDSFAGGFLGYLASHGCDIEDPVLLKRALLHGSVMASFTVESFSTERLESLKPAEIHKRYHQYLEMLAVELIPAFAR
ncbi:MAG: sugar kinase [Elusimicrobia bacterium]|nr:sugar kinase [Elusimicrobiota bacterium]